MGDGVCLDGIGQALLRSIDFISVYLYAFVKSIYTYSLKKPSHIVCTFINIDIGINMNTNIYIYIHIQIHKSIWHVYTCLLQ